MNQSHILHVGFLEKLPYDIISNIFSYLDQRDCLNCMATSRGWYDQIPQFTRANWKTLEINKKGVNQCQERNLGKHVKHIVFNAIRCDLLAKIMQKLLDCECDEIESLEFTRCTSGTTKEQQSVFLNLLRSLASYQLTYLNMKYHNWNFSILDLLFVCPHLTHFSYQADDYSNSSNHDYKSIQLLPSDQMSYNTLIYLHVDTESHIIKDQVQSIICKSPNIRYFIGASVRSCRAGPKILISPEFVLERCPKLQYYAGDGSYQRGDGIIKEALRISSNTLLLTPPTATNKIISCKNNDQQQQQQQIPFNHLAVRNNWNPNQIISLLSKYKDALKHFRLSQTAWTNIDNPFDWTHTFQTTPMQQLRTLYCDVIIYSKEAIVTLLNTCRNTIQEVYLQYLRYQIFDVLTLQSLKTLPQLRTLSIQYFQFEDESSVFALLERLSSLENLILEQKKPIVFPERAAPFLKNLRHLTLVDTYTSIAGDAPFTRPPLVAPRLFVSLAQLESKLESVRLKGDFDGSSQFIILKGLAALPSLKSLNVNGMNAHFHQERDKEKQEHHMLDFFNGLLRGHDYNTNNIISTSPKTTIENLTLSRIYKLTHAMLNVLGDLTNLQMLSISLVSSYNETTLATLSDSPYLNIDLYGVLELLRKSKKLRKVIFQGMISYSKHVLPSDYLKKKLTEVQPSNSPLRKYVVKPGSLSNIDNSGVFIESNLEIINQDYK